VCFYCDEALDLDDVHVDHVIPRSFLQHDEIWNLVLAHEACNLAKSARLPALPYVERLFERDEYYIASNHPIKHHLVAQTGTTPTQRRAFLNEVYREAQRVFIHVWPGGSGASLPNNPLRPLQLTAHG
jgi:CRISPR/Cas system Type II protein with McrA/HNH and RuvC-like nuclease domain